MTFQHLVAILDIIQYILLDQLGDKALIEGKTDIVDYQIANENDVRVMARQAKTRVDTDTWSPAELAETINRWAAEPDAQSASFAFVTDGLLGPSAVTLDGLLSRVRDGSADDAAVETEARSIGRGITLPGVDVLRNVSLISRAGTAEQLLERLEYRVLQLLQRNRIASPQDAEAAVNKLFTKVSVMAGEADPAARVLTRTDLLTTLGLTDEDLRTTGEWDESSRSKYQVAVGSTALIPGYVDLQLIPVSTVPSAIPSAGVETDQQSRHVPVDELLETHDAVLLAGGTGTGKSTALLQIARSAAAGGLVPIMLNADGHPEGTLPLRIRNAAEQGVGSILSPGAAQRLQADPGLVLIIDGVSETDEGSRQALANDLARLSASATALRFVLAGRDLPILRSVAPDRASASAFRLQPLSATARMRVATQELGDSAATWLDKLERGFGRDLENPMLFGMAVRLKVEPSAGLNRSRLYEMFLQELVAHNALPEPEYCLDALGVAWSRLIQKGTRSASRYEWLGVLRDAQDLLQARGIWQGMAAPATPDVLAEATRIGLLVRANVEGGLAPLHDSFADYLSSVVMVRGLTSLPGLLQAQHDEQALFYAEQAGLTMAFATLLAARPALAARVARVRFEESANPVEIDRLVRELAGRALPSQLQSAFVSVHDGTDFTIAVLTGNPSQHLALDEVALLATDTPFWSFRKPTNDLTIALAIWTSILNAQVEEMSEAYQRPAPREIAEAVVVVERYFADMSEHLDRLLLLLPEGLAQDVAQTVGPRGLIGIVRIAEGQIGHDAYLDLRYDDADEISVQPGSPDTDDGEKFEQAIPVENLLHLHPWRRAENRLTSALGSLSDESWPRL